MKTRLIVLVLMLATFAAAQTTRSVVNSELQQGYFAVTIANTATTSDGVLLRGRCIPVGVVIPAAWTTANLTVEETVDGTNWGAVRDEYGTVRTITVSAVTNVIRWSNVSDWLSVWGIRFVSTNAQGGTRSLKVLCAKQP